MKKQNTFSPEVRKRALRLVPEHRQDYQSLWAGVTTDERERMKKSPLSF